MVVQHNQYVQITAIRYYLRVTADNGLWCFLYCTPLPLMLNSHHLLTADVPYQY